MRVTTKFSYKKRSGGIRDCGIGEFFGEVKISFLIFQNSFQEV
jgi:hypothetical protein